MSSRHCHEYQSLGQRFTGSKEKDLLVIIENFGPNTFQVLLVNKFYGRQCRKLLRQLSLLMMTLAIVLFTLRTLILWQIILLNGILLFWLMIIFVTCRKLVKQEKFLYCDNLGIQIQSQSIFGWKNYFIASAHIYDIVINEICENLNYRYLLIVRTKGSLFKKSPIIPIFKYLKPTWECLAVIYKQLKLKRYS